MSALTNAADRVDEARHFAELLALATEGIAAEDAGAIGPGVNAILERLAEASRILSSLCDAARLQEAGIVQAA